MRRVFLLMTVLIVTAACGGSTDPGSGTADQTTPARAGTPASRLVGTWSRVTTCGEFVQAQTEAGFEVNLEELAGSEWLQLEQIEDPEHPCAGAVPREHSHFWTEDGQFGSLDSNGNPVDDGTYEITEDHTLVMPYLFEQGPPIQVEFRFEIQGDTLALDPVIPSDCSTKNCREAASWSVAVAYPGKTWNLVV